jgi:hypothetical protein
MAKRTKFGNRSTARPAAKRPAKPAAAGSTPAPGPVRAAPLSDLDAAMLGADDDMPVQSSSALTEAEIARAAQLEAEANARERTAIADSLRRRTAAGSVATKPVGDINAPLSVRMSHEYAYVARDVKRIVLTASLMVAILAVLDILVNVMGVITL